MATPSTVYSPPEDLTSCGVCNDIINEPKALTCLHTFCLECLKEWSKQSSKIVTCPIGTCKKTTPMPCDGVEGLPGNVFVSSLKERSPQASPDPSVETLQVPRVSSSAWILERTFTTSRVSGMSTTSTGDIAIAHWPDEPIAIYSINGDLKLTLGKQSIDASTVVVNSAGQLYGPCGKLIRMFGSDGQYLSQFPAISPAGVASDAEDTNLMGLAINHKNQLLIGEFMNTYISIHDLNGVHVTSFKVFVPPYFIATTSNDDITVSSECDVQILDNTGTLKHTINAPDDVSNWNPRCVCCSINDEICIGNFCTPYAVYCFTCTRGYVGCITKDVKYPWAMKLFENDQKLAVAEYNGCVKIYRRE